MNRKNKWYIQILFGLLFMLSNCTEDYLEKEPDNRSRLDALDKIAETLVYAYPKYSYDFTERMTDNVTYVPDEDEVNWVREIYEWSENISSTYNDSPTGYWNTAYEAIAQANVVLEKIKGIKGGDSTYRNAIMGEALLCRAYAHFMLVNLFAKNYNTDTSSSDLGIPYVTQVEKKLIVSYQRNTVQEVYDLVEKDLLEGLELVSSQYYKNSGKFHFNKKAALAFASRFYLWKGSYEKAEEYATQLLSQGESQFVRNYQEDVLTPSSKDDYGINFTNPSVNANLLLAKCYVENTGSAMHYLDSSPAYSISTNIGQEIFTGGDSDKRNKIRLRYGGWVNYPKWRRLFEYTNIIQDIGNRLSTIVWFRGEEVLFNRAEARLLKKNPDIAGAESDLNYILNDRYTDSTKASSLKDSYIKEGLSQKEALKQVIIDERRREFINEGLRWFDIRRFHIPVTHLLRDGTIDTLTEDDPRRALQIPISATSLKVKPNPR